MDCVAIIPARYASSRFPGKLLTSVAGRPLIEHVIGLTRRIDGIDAVVVATDNEGIAAAAEEAGVEAVVTGNEYASGTDRVADIAKGYSAKIVLNVQGDELLLDTDGVAAALASFRKGKIDLGTLRAPLREAQDLWDPNVVKVVIDDNERALYFSRAPVPFPRAAMQAVSDEMRRSGPWLDRLVEGKDSMPAAWVHLGVYLYRADALQRWAALPPSRLELAEGLEQLRVLEAGEPMQTYPIDDAVPGVNTPGDLERAEAALAVHTAGTKQ